MTETLEIVLKPFLKWPGGKSKELKEIIPNLPHSINNFYEPFIGGGAVYFATTSANHYFINDKSKDLIDLYNNIKSLNKFELFSTLNKIDKYWKDIDYIYDSNKNTFVEFFLNYRKCDNFDLKLSINEFINSIAQGFTEPIKNDFQFDFKFYLKEIKLNLTRKMSRMKKIELEKGILSNSDVNLNILTALKSSFYMYFRMLYNNKEKYQIEPIIHSGIYFFIRNYTYSGMFRYNSNGEFNVPYGGIGYNNNSIDKKVLYLSDIGIQNKLYNTTIENLDFYECMANKEIYENDFIFLDPPYDTEFSTYDQNEFTKNDQKRLSNFLINEVNCNWMLVIKTLRLYMNFIIIKIFSSTILTNHTQ